MDYFNSARQKLSPNYLGAGLPGRETQTQELYNFLFERLKIHRTSDEKRAKVESGQVVGIKGRHMNKTMFVCGVPGTGKTATVMSVIHKLEGLLSQRNPPIHKFEHAYINGQLITSVERVYSEILLKFSNETCGPEEAQERLETMFTSGCDYITKSNRRKTGRKISNSFKIVIIDELDLLYNDKRQTVFYSLFDWPTSNDSKMILIAIANAMDLPERFRGRIESRLGWNKLVFESYTSNCLRTIIKTRLGTDLMNKCFEAAAITIACTRIGKTTGDARRILDTCRLAIDNAVASKAPKVTGTIIDEVGFQNLDAQRRNYVFKCGPLELIVLKCIIQEVERVGEESVEALNIYQRVVCMMNTHYRFQGYLLGMKQFHKILNSVAGVGMIYLEADKCLTRKKIYLKDTSDQCKDLIKSGQVKP